MQKNVLILKTMIIVIGRPLFTENNILTWQVRKNYKYTYIVVSHLVVIIILYNIQLYILRTLPL